MATKGTHKFHTSPAFNTRRAADQKTQAGAAEKRETPAQDKRERETADRLTPSNGTFRKPGD